MTDGYSAHMESVLLARQQANEVIQQVFHAGEKNEELLGLVIQAVGEMPVNDPGCQALEQAASIKDKLDEIVQILEQVKFNLDEYGGLIR